MLTRTFRLMAIGLSFSVLAVAPLCRAQLATAATTTGTVRDASGAECGQSV